MFPVTWNLHGSSGSIVVSSVHSYALYSDAFSSHDVQTSVH